MPAGDYAAEATPETERLGRWRALGARIKADHVVALCAGRTFGRVVEVGCGDGALLAELSSRGLADRFDGFEVSPEGVEIARRRGIPRVERLEAYPGDRIPAEDGDYDLAICSHVLEHVEDPAPVVRELTRVAQLVLVEVPLEDNPSARRPARRSEALRIGHVQELSRADVLALLHTAGLRVVDELSDALPYEHQAFFGGGPKARVRWAVRNGVHAVAPRLAQRAFTVHLAVLAER